MYVDENIQCINEKYGEIPDYVYHARVGNKNMSDEEIFRNINIFESCEDLPNNYNLTMGRINLDCSFHAFYTTPCRLKAIKWILIKGLNEKNEYQILKFKINVGKLKLLNVNTQIVPDKGWAENIYLNRSGKLKRNVFDCVYNFIADGKMRDIIANINKYENDIKNFHMDILDTYKSNNFIEDYYENRTFNYKDIIKAFQLGDTGNYQLAICSSEALGCFELVGVERYKDKSELKVAKKECNSNIINIEGIEDYVKKRVGKIKKRNIH